MRKRLQNKTAIVVGAGTKGEGLGNGKAVAMQFAREGANVLCVDRDRSSVEITAEAIRKEGGRTEVCVADIANGNDCEWVVNKCLAVFK